MKICRILSVFFLCVVLLTSVLAPGASASEILDSMEVEAKAALLVDPDTDEVLYEKNIHEKLYPASLTKVMTCLLVLEAIDRGDLALEDTLTASEYAIESIPDGSSTADLKVGEQLTVQDLLYCIMVVSANEATNILAEAVSGTVEAFVAEMNAKADALGCENTHFVNPNGLHDEDHYTTARDLYVITKAAMEHEDFMPIANTKSFTLPATEFHDKRTLYTTNYLLSPYRAAGYVYTAAVGIKTGSTTPAGNCLISSANKNGRNLVGIILGAEKVTLENGNTQVQSFTEMKRMFEWGFSNFSRQTILSSKELIAELEVSLSETSHIVVQPAYDVERLLPDDVAVEDLTRTTRYDAEVVEAPISAGQELGEISVSYGDTVYATVPLVAQNDVAASRLLVFQHNVKTFVARTEVKIAAIAILVLIVVLLVLVKTSGRRRRRYGRGGGYYHARNYRGRRR